MQAEIGGKTMTGQVSPIAAAAIEAAMSSSNRAYSSEIATRPPADLPPIQD